MKVFAAWVFASCCLMAIVIGMEKDLKILAKDKPTVAAAAGFVHCRNCQNHLSRILDDKEHDAWIATISRAEDGHLHIAKCEAVSKCFYPTVIWSGSGDRPFDMPARKGDREFDGGPDFGNGSWAQRDEDGHWRRYGG